MPTWDKGNDIRGIVSVYKEIHLVCLQTFYILEETNGVVGHRLLY